MTEEDRQAGVAASGNAAGQQEEQQQQSLLAGLESWFVEQGGVLNKVRGKLGLRRFCLLLLGSI